jgi:hypothetical protein
LPLLVLSPTLLFLPSCLCLRASTVVSLCWPLELCHYPILPLVHIFQLGPLPPSPAAPAPPPHPCSTSAPYFSLASSVYSPSLRSCSLKPRSGLIPIQP